MVWAKLENRINDDDILLYDFYLTPEGYCLQVTDLLSLWEESLSAEAIIKRNTDTGSEISVETSNERSGFFKTLELYLQDAVITSGEDTDLVLQVSGILESTEIQWTFRPSKQPDAESARQIKAIALDLIEVLASASEQIEDFHRSTKKIGYHVRQMSRMCTYDPPKYREQFYAYAADTLSSEPSSSSSQMHSSLSMTIPSSPIIHAESSSAQKDEIISRGLDFARAHWPEHDDAPHDAGDDADVTITALQSDSVQASESLKRKEMAEKLKSNKKKRKLYI